MEQTTTANNPRNCPLCGGNNHCAIVTGSASSDCWCRHHTISPDLISQAAALQPASCICQACSERALQLGEEIS